MGDQEVTIEWKIGEDRLKRDFKLRDGKLLVSQFFLQSLLPPTFKFISLKAIIECGNEHIKVKTPSQWDVEGKEHFILDISLSKTYIIEHSEQNEPLLYISDSEGEDDFISGSEQGYDSVVVLEEGNDEFKEHDNILEEVPGDTKCPISTHEKIVDLIDNEDIQIQAKSIVPWILQSNGAHSLKKRIANSTGPIEVIELPVEYNGNIIFELPPTNGVCKNMDGMEQRFDGHIWTRPFTTNMSIACTVRISYCLGSLKCPRLGCQYYLDNKTFNHCYFHGFLDKKIGTGQLCNDGKTKIFCHYCKNPAYCIDTCNCMVYYVMPKDDTMTRLMVHVGHHQHLVQSGTSQAKIEKVRHLVRNVLQLDRNSGPRKVQMIVARQLLMDSLIFRNDEADDRTLGETELTNFLEELIPLIQNQRFKTIVADEKHKGGFFTNEGFDSILQLKKRCMFPFFHGSRFPGQGGPNEKCFVFKMSTIGPGSGVDLVNRMCYKGDGDLRHAWVHFDHTHRIDGWATMSCSVYDPSIKSLMVIAISKMKEEDVEAQILFWENLNSVMNQCGHPKAEFAGFMADEAGANWNAIRTVFNGGPDNVIEGRERSCLFHWEQSLQKHTRKLIPSEERKNHVAMCENWRLCHTIREANKQAAHIREWWQRGNVPKENLRPLEKWFSWWESRILHWGSQNKNDNKSPWEQAQIPNTNLSESIHASWLAGEGYKQKISLYDACVTDVINSYIQCTKQLGFLTGRYEGHGPSMETCLKCVSVGRTPSPMVIARVVQEAGHTSLLQEPVMHGDKETVQRKRKCINANSSHKPGYVMEARQRTPRGRPRKISFTTAPQEMLQSSTEDPVHVETQQEDVHIDLEDHEESGDKPGIRGDGQQCSTIVEQVIPSIYWAFCRMPIHCTRRCFGIINGKKCHDTLQSRSTGLVAPCFWSEREYPGASRPKSQWMWFCVNISHTKDVSRVIKTVPDRPNIWPVDIGTNITNEELAHILQSGFKLCTKSSLTTPRTQSRLDTRAEASLQRSKKWRHGISKDAEKKIAAAEDLQANLFAEETISAGSHVVFHIMTQASYEVHVKVEPYCTCPDFQSRETKKKPFLACKHMYFIYLRVLGLHKNKHMIMHQPVLASQDVTFILSQPRLIRAK